MLRRRLRRADANPGKEGGRETDPMRGRPHARHARWVDVRVYVKARSSLVRASGAGCAVDGSARGARGVEETRTQTARYSTGLSRGT